MQLVAGALNGKYLLEVHERAIQKADAVKAAIAYAAGESRIIEDCLRNNIVLIFYGRYDVSVPVALPILKRFLDAKSPGLVCKLIPDIFHPKVIWWQGAGVYIGSANLTANGWFGNIEAGLYLEDSELADHALDEELEDFFAEIDQLSHPLTLELYEELKAHEGRSSEVHQYLNNVEKQLNRTRRLPFLAPLTRVNVRTMLDKRKDAFSAEWSNTLQSLRDIGDRISDDEIRPSWISKNVPKGVQVDQFLHAFYYSNVREGVRSRHYEFHKKNRSVPEQAFADAISWWRSLGAPPHSEDVTIEEWAPFIRNNMAQDKLLSLSSEEFTQVCGRIHALRDHALRVRKETLGLPANSKAMEREQRIRLLGQWLYQQRSPEGKTVLQTIDYVLYGGPRRDLPDRIWAATHSDKWSIPHFGVSTIGELVGWALPDDFPPRNGRTSKALFALGYPVTIHSE